jgi:hypothetical protein
MVARWTHAFRLPGPHADRCVVDVHGSPCGCDRPVRLERLVHLEQPDTCSTCGHEVLAAFSVPPMTTSPEPPR